MRNQGENVPRTEESILCSREYRVLLHHGVGYKMDHVNTLGCGGHQINQACTKVMTRET